MSTVRAIDKLTGPLRRRIMLMLGRAVLRLVDDAAGLQRVQVTLLAGEVRDGVERVQQYGFTAHPHPGAEAVVVNVGGNRDHPLAIAIDDRRHRKRDLQRGEVAVYTDEGDYVLLRRGRVVEVVTETLLIKASAKVRIETPQVEATGEIVDRVDSGGISMRAMRETYNQHRHPESDGGQTGTPGSQM